MKLITFAIILLFSIQLSAQDFETIPVNRPSAIDHLDIIKLLVRYNDQLLKEYDSIFVYSSEQLIDKIDLNNIRNQVAPKAAFSRLDSVVNNNTIEFYQGENLKKKKIFDSQERLTTEIEFESNSINRKRNYLYDNDNNLILKQTFEFWSASPDSSLEEEIKYKYKNFGLEKIEQKSVRPINRSYNLYIKSFDKDKNLKSSETKMFSPEGDIFLDKKIDITIDKESNQISKIKSIFKETVDADLEYNARTIVMKINY